MSVAETLESIKFSVRIARQHAYLGLYEESSKAFERALNSIRIHYARLDDKILVNEWKSTENDVYNEMTVVNDVKNMVQGTKADSHNLETYEIYEDKGCHENFNPNEQKIVIPNEVKRYPFGKKPFQGQSRIGEEKPVNEGQPYLNQEKPSQAKPAAQKDKDIWDPPSPKAKPKSFVKKLEPIQKRKPVVEKVSGQKVTDSVKPTKNEKKSYLYHCYPDGKGPDADLIQMLEKDVVDQNPNVQFDDIASLEEAKQILQETVLLPLLCPGLFVGIRRPWSGVLMFGPPGTGKTLLAKAVATLGKTTFFSITAGALTSKWRGESEKLVKILFEMARFYAPTTIFCDEIDALCSKRGGSGEHETSRRVISELLIQMDGMHTVTSASANEQANEEQKKTITVIGATNRPWDLDEAFRRRLEKRIYIPLPTEEGRKELFRINLKGIKLADDVDFPFLVKNTDGYSGADIASVCREAAMMPIRKKLLEGGGILNQLNDIEKLTSEMDVPITQKDFNNAIKNVRKSVSDTDLENYAKWMADFGAT